ncbi:hypothetical protein FS837_005162 [Tulasnella sp. UAMH 9824]|nr:hypothetical protein FS837_005162 [Tulasnella sp. UAMH 9824]
MEDSSYGLGAEEYAETPLVGKEHARTPGYPGLVIFEIIPSLASRDIAERESAWSNQLRRLGRVLRRLEVENPYEVGFVVLFWGDTGRDLDEQRDEVYQRVSSYIREYFPALKIKPEVAAFGSTERYEETFEQALQTTHLDPVGRFLAKHRFQDIIQAHFDVWETFIVDGLIVAESFQVEYPLVKWPAIGRLFSLAIASLQDLEQRSCDIIEIIVDEPLPPFDSSRVTDEESLRQALLAYLSTEPFVTDILFDYIRSELNHTSARRQDLPVRRILSQLGWHIIRRLESVASDVVGDSWQSSVEEYRQELRRSIDGLSAIVDAHVHKVPNGTESAVVKKRSRVPSGDRGTPAQKKVRSSLLAQNTFGVPKGHDPHFSSASPTQTLVTEPPRETKSSHTLSQASGPPRKSDLEDLMRLIAESEAMLT